MGGGSLPPPSFLHALNHGRATREPTPRGTGGAMPCPHGRQRHACKECGGSGICEHGRQRHACKKCGGSSIRKHGQRHSRCSGGSDFCEHGRRRSRSKDCGLGDRVIILDATAVEGVDVEEEPHESCPTVQVTPVAPRGGKRKLGSTTPPPPPAPPPPEPPEPLFLSYTQRAVPDPSLSHKFRSKSQAKKPCVRSGSATISR